MGFCAGLIILAAVFFSLSPKKHAGFHRLEKQAVAKEIPEPAHFFVNNYDNPPDGLIVTETLSELPKDILKAPLLSDLLTEEFVFYYESTEGFLGLKGTLRRIAYEHQLNAFDGLIKYLLNTPAEIAFWKSYNGKLEQFMLIVKKTELDALLEAAAKVAIDDKQLSLYKEVEISSHIKVRIYKLHYAHNRDIYFTGWNDQFVLFSDPEMKLPTPEQQLKWTDLSKARVGESKNKPAGVFLKLFEPEEEKRKHAVYLSAHYLSFGYQSFFPSLDAVKFRYSKSGWESYILAKSPGPKEIADTSALWSAVPKSSLCVGLPLDPSRTGELMKTIFQTAPANIEILKHSIQSAAGICWSSRSELFTPLFVLKTDGKIEPSLLKEFFEKSIGALEAGILTEEEKALFQEQKQMRANGEAVEDPVKATQFVPPFPVMEEKGPKAITWSREVSSKFGLYEAEKSKKSNEMKSKRYFIAKLAYAGGFVLFSADNRLVDAALSVIDRKYPAVADLLPENQSHASLIVFPEETAALLRQSMLESLPDEQESIFKESVSKRLFPVLDKLNAYPPHALSLPENLSALFKWEKVNWGDISRK